MDPKLEELTIEQLEGLSRDLELEHQALLARKKAVNDTIAEKQELRKQAIKNPLGVATLGRI